MKVYDSGIRPGIQNFLVVKSPDGKSLQLTWTYQAKGDYWFVIYRSVNRNAMITLNNIKSDQHSFTDTDSKNGIYQYSIKVVYRDGGESTIIKSEGWSPAVFISNS